MTKEPEMRLLAAQRDEAKIALLNAAIELKRADYDLGCALSWLDHAGRPELLAEVDGMFKRCIEIRESIQKEYYG